MVVVFLAKNLLVAPLERKLKKITSANGHTVRHSTSMKLLELLYDVF